MKKFLAGVIVGAAMMLSFSVFAESVQKIEAYLNPEVKINLDGEPLILEKTPIIYEGSTYLPLREIAEKVMGVAVNWNDETKTVELTTPIDESLIWPVDDVTKVPLEEGETPVDEPNIVEPVDKTKDDVWFGVEYESLFVRDHGELTVAEIDEKINAAHMWKKRFEGMLEKQNQYPGIFPDIVIERIIEDLPKLQEALEYWESLKKQMESQE